MLRALGQKSLELLIVGAFAVAVAGIALLWVSKASEQFTFSSTAGAAIATASIAPAWGDDATVKLMAVGMAVYAGDSPRIDVQVEIAGKTVVTNIGSKDDKVETPHCTMFSEPPLQEQGAAIQVKTRVTCLVRLSDLASSEVEVPIVVSMTLRGNSTNNEGTPAILASGTYSIDGGIVHRIMSRL